jgi:hypothetical protein
MENSLQEYYQYLSGAGSEFPVATEMIKSAVVRATENSGFVDNTKVAATPKINTTDEDVIKNYVLEKMAGRSLKDQQSVLTGINLRLEQLRTAGEKIVPETIIQQIEDKTFL